MNTQTLNIAYMTKPNDAFISNKINHSTFIELIGRFSQTIPIDCTKEDLGFGSMTNNQFDYIVLDFKSFGHLPFLLREKYNLNVRFILNLHTIIPWFEQLLYIVPLLRKTDIIISPSKYSKQCFLRISDKIDVTVIPLCLDIKTIQANLSHTPEKQTYTLTYLGRITEDKGIGLIIDLLPEIKKHINNIKLNIIGPLKDSEAAKKESSFVKTIRRKIKDLHLEETVILTGPKFGKEKYSSLANSDIFINLTNYIGETFGVNNIEALACGLPIIASNWAAHSEMIDTEKTGFIIDFYNIKNKTITFNKDTVSNYIIKLLLNKDLLCEMKKNAYLKAMQYDVSAIIPKVITLLKNNIQSNKTISKISYKKKTASDFLGLYTKDVLFFLKASNFFKYSYDSIYNISIKDQQVLTFYSSEKLATEQKKNLSIHQKLQQDLWHYICFG